MTHNSKNLKFLVKVMFSVWNKNGDLITKKKEKNYLKIWRLCKNTNNLENLLI